MFGHLSAGQQSPAIFGQFKGTSQRLTALTVATTLCTLALVFQSIDRSPHQPQQNIQLFISAAALLTGCLLVGMQGAAAAGALCTSYSFSQKQKQSVAARGRGGYSQLQRSMIHNLRNGPLTASTYYDPAKHKSHRVIIASSTQPADKSGVGSVPIPESPFAVSTENDKVKSLQRAKAPTAEMVAEIAFERHASQSQVNRGEEGGGRPRHMHDTSASGTSMEALASEAAAPPQTPAPAISSKPRHPDLHARLSAAYAPGGRSALTSYAEERGEEGSRSDAAAADLLYSMRDPSEHRRMLEGMSEQEEEPHRNPLLFFANEDQD